MANDIEKMQHQKQQIRDELKSASVSRRGFIDRIKTLGFGFGAAVGLGLCGAEARDAPDTSVNLTSTNPALNTIINEADKQEGQTEPGEKGSRRRGIAASITVFIAVLAGAATSAGSTAAFNSA